MEQKKVDVLALLDAYIEHGIPQERPDLQRARAAVAELIEAARDYVDAVDNADDEREFQAEKRLRAALAAVDGRS